MHRFRLRFCFYLAHFTVTLTGAYYFWIKYLLPEPQDVFSILKHPWQQTILKGHILTGALATGVLGMLYGLHAFPKLEQAQAKGRRTGIFLTGMSALMVFSGFAIQVLSTEGPRRTVAIVHMGVSGFFVFGVLTHEWVVAARRNK